MPKPTSRKPSASAAPAADLTEGRVILTVRGHRVILSTDLARVYGVEHRVLNQAVRRNADRFPPDFAFRLNAAAVQELARLRSQSVILDRGSEEGGAILRSQSVILRWGTHSKYPPVAFTEHGALMAATVLNSPRAVQMSVFVVRAFLRLRQLVSGQERLAAKLAALERRVTDHDRELQGVIATLRELLQPPPDPTRPKIGFA